MAMQDDERSPSRLTVAILVADAIVLLVLFVSISSTSAPRSGSSPTGSGGVTGSPHGIESVMWLLLVPLGAAIFAMAYLGVREIIGLRRERHQFAHRPAAEQRRLRDAGSVLHGVSAGAPQVADRLATGKRSSRRPPRPTLRT